MLPYRLVVGQRAPHNAAAVVRGPKPNALRGKTRMPARDEAKALIASIPTGSLLDRRRCGSEDGAHSA